MTASESEAPSGAAPISETPASPLPDGRYRCRFCGSDEVEASAWVGLNDEALSSWDETPNYWCPACNEHRRGVCFVHADETCRYHGRPFRECLAEAAEEEKENAS